MPDPIIETLTAKYLVRGASSVTVTPIVEVDGNYRRSFRITGPSESEDNPPWMFEVVVEAEAPDGITFTMPDVLF